MLKKILLVVITIATQSVFSTTNIEGTWNISGLECLSGVPINTYGENYTSSITGVAKFTADKIDFKMLVNWKMIPEYAANVTKQLNDENEVWIKQPESPEKQKALDEIKKSLELIAMWSAGVNCEVSQIMSHRLTDSVINFTITDAHSTCDGETNTIKVGSSFANEYSLKNGLLRIVSESETTDKGSCPKGDRQVTVFKK